ncbi:MAG: PEP-utilizing enzyme, partial [Candidatus Aenigmatarchaeota archaeon]
GNMLGLISDYGGMSSNASRIARELGIPMVTGTDTAFRLLKDGQEVHLDGSEGTVNETGAVEREEFETQMDVEEGRKMDTADSVTATEIFVSIDTGDVRKERTGGADGYILDMQKQDSFRNDSFGVERNRNKVRDVVGSVNSDVWVNVELEGMESTAERLRELHLSGMSNGHLLISSVTTPREYRETLDNTSIPNTMEVGVVIDTPLMALSMERMGNEDVDLVVLDLSKLVELMFGSKNIDKRSMLSDELWNIIENIVENCKEKQIKTCISGDFDRKLLRKFIRTGIDCIFTAPETFEKVKNEITRAERKILLERMG